MNPVETSAPAGLADRSKRKVRLLTLLLVLIILAQGAVVYACVSRAAEAKVVHLVSEADLKKTLLPGAPSEELLRTTAYYYLNTLEDYNPESIEIAYKRILRRVSPANYGTARQFFEKRVKEAQDNQAGADMEWDDLDAAEVRRLSDSSWSVRLRGRQITRMGASFFSPKEFIFEIIFTVRPPSEGNPFGLYIGKISRAPAKKEAAK